MATNIRNFLDWQSRDRALVNAGFNMGWHGHERTIATAEHNAGALPTTAKTTSAAIVSLDRPLPAEMHTMKALIRGVSVTFESHEDKLAALVEAWRAHNSGRSIVDFHHLSHLQIIGMGPRALPILLRRVAEGESRWVYALKCIAGDQADLPGTVGDADAVVAAWTDWGTRNGLI